MFPGLRAGLIARARYLDAAFCLRSLGGACRICARIAALEAGQPVEIKGEEVWRALTDPRNPRACIEFLHDPRIYELTGDRLAVLGERHRKEPPR
jgi:hypothetical protein